MKTAIFIAAALGSAIVLYAETLDLFRNPHRNALGTRIVIATIFLLAAAGMGFLAFERLTVWCLPVGVLVLVARWRTEKELINLMKSARRRSRQQRRNPDEAARVFEQAVAFWIGSLLLLAAAIFAIFFN